MDTKAYEKIQKPAYTDIHGTYPKEVKEVMLPMRALEEIGISKPYIGMDIPLKITLVNDSIREEHFRLSGYYTEYVDPMVGAPRGYFSQAFLDGLKLNIQENTTLLIQQKDTITDEKIEERLYFDTGIFLVVMILIGAYLLIHNVLQISLSRDIRQYGLLKVLGTTGVQLRKVVYR